MGELRLSVKSFGRALYKQVLGHKFNADDFVKGADCVVEHGGKLPLMATFAWSEKEQLFDCARYSSIGLWALLERLFVDGTQRILCRSLRNSIALLTRIYSK